MKRTLIAAAALIAATTAAQAELDLEMWSVTCGPPRLLLGTLDGNPVVKTEITYDRDRRLWQVFHHLLNGQVMSRSAQYAIADQSNRRRFQWTGWYFRNRVVQMVGEVSFGPRGPVYSEWAYDRSRGNRLTMHAVAANCEFYD